MTENKIFLIDTNVLVYAYEKENSSRKEKAQKILEKCYRNETTLAISNQNLAEFSAVAIKKLKIDSKLIREIVKDISKFESFKKISYKRKTILSAIDISEEYEMSFWDSLITATMIENGISNIYTENSKDFKIQQINVVNPFV